MCILHHFASRDPQNITKCCKFTQNCAKCCNHARLCKICCWGEMKSSDVPSLLINQVQILQDPAKSLAMSCTFFSAEASIGGIQSQNARVDWQTCFEIPSTSHKMVWLSWIDPSRTSDGVLSPLPAVLLLFHPDSPWHSRHQKPRLRRYDGVWVCEGQSLWRSLPLSCYQWSMWPNSLHWVCLLLVSVSAKVLK